MTLPPEALTAIAVFIGSISGGIIVAEYTLHRGKNMIATGIKQAIKDTMPFIDEIKKGVTATFPFMPVIAPYTEKEKKNDLAT